MNLAFHRLRLPAAPVLALVLVAVVWGLTYPLTGTLLRVLPPQLLLCLRFGTAFLVVLPYLMRARPGNTLLLAGLGLGVVQYFEFSTLTAGLALTPPGRSALLVSLSVVLVGLFDALVQRRTPARSTACALLITGLGLALIQGPAAWRGGPGLGDALCLGCAALTAVQVVWTGMLMRTSGVAPAVLVALQLGTVALLSGVVSAGHGDWRAVDWGALHGLTGAGVLLGVLFLALVATVLALLAQTWAQSQVGASRVGLIYALEPVVAASIGVGFLGEQLGWLQVGGGLLVLIGITGIQSATLRRLFQLGAGH